jgi:N-acetylglucosaminyl-diphospho-decaprenol L-rhamnosyltransferase
VHNGKDKPDSNDNKLFFVMKTVDIIIVNWNSGKQLAECIESVAQSQLQNCTINKVVVVDNCSIDNSANIATPPGLNLEIILNKTNQGFGYACNQGAANSQADFILFLNPDTRLFEHSLSEALNFFDSPQAAHVGICGVQLIDEHNHKSYTCSRFPNPKTILGYSVGLQYVFPNAFPKQLMIDWPHDQDRVVDQVMGAFFLVRRPIFEKLQGFDERFFVYYEEVDFALRAKLAGWDSYYLAGTQIYHKGGGTTTNIRGRSLFYYLRSRLMYGYKHFSFSVATVVAIATFVTEPFARLFRSLITKSQQEAVGTIAAYWYLIQWLGGLMIKGSRQGR